MAKVLTVAGHYGAWPHPMGTVVRLSVDDVDGDCEEEVEDVWLQVVAALQTLLDQPSGAVTGD